MNGLLFALLLVGVFAAVETIYYVGRYLNERPAEELKRRLQTLGSPTAGIQVLRQRRLSSSRWMSDLLSGVDTFERLERLLDQTDLEMSVARLVFVMMSLSGVGVVGCLVMRQPLLCLLAGPVLFFFPLLTVFSARATRAKKISEQLPDTLEMMVRAVKAGHALPASFKLVAQECPAPIAVEFAKAYEQQNLGLSLEAAIQSMTERVPSNLDLKLLAVSVKIQKETGGNLVEMLENISSTMRERFKFFSKLRALTAEGRVSGVILGALPIFVALLITLVNPDYLSELGHGLGAMILAGGVFLWALGIVWIRSLMKVVY